jgi:hypothetical protein
MTDLDLHEQIKQKRKEGWIEAWFAIETLGLKKEMVEESLQNHIEKLSNVPDTLVYEKNFKDIELVKTPLKNVNEAWSYVCEIRLFVKNLYTLLNIIYMYGPSAVEILNPASKEMKIDEMQDIANTLAGLIHQFAAAGIGGIIITPEKKKACG